MRVVGLFGWLAMATVAPGTGFVASAAAQAVRSSELTGWWTIEGRDATISLRLNGPASQLTGTLELDYPEGPRDEGTVEGEYDWYSGRLTLRRPDRQWVFELRRAGYDVFRGRVYEERHPYRITMRRVRRRRAAPR